MRRSPMFAVIRILAIVALAMAAVAIPASAQDDDDDDEFGAYIYEGTVDDYGDNPVEDLEGLESVRDDDDNDDDDNDRDVWEVIGNDDSEPDPLYVEDDEEIGMTIDELTSEPHVLAIHADDDPDSEVIAIGAIEGDRDDDGGLMVDLEEVDDSGFEGRAYFQPDDDDDDDDGAEVAIGIWEAGAVDAAATPEATPAS